MQTMIGVIGGSGLYQIDGLEGASWVKVKTPWGAPSDEVLVGRLDGVPMAFLPRHGRGHVHSPSSVPYRANIDALKRLGCTDVISVSACGSFREEFAWPMSALPTPPAPVLAQPAPKPRWRRGSPSTAPEHISAWKGRSSRPLPKAASTAPGAAT
jgi:hypothetical protein